MDDLDSNPLQRAFLTKFRSCYEIACKMGYLIAIPRSETLDNLAINQSLANSHILMPSKLLKMHYIPLQMGHYEDIEMHDNKLICHPRKQRSAKPTTIKIVAQETSYNVDNKEYRTILVDKPLIEMNTSGSVTTVALLSPRSPFVARNRHFRPIMTLPVDHIECSRRLEHVSQDLTRKLEADVKKLQTYDIFLAQYLDDAAEQISSLVGFYLSKYEGVIERKMSNPGDIRGSDSFRYNLRISIENHVVHLLHGKLMEPIRAEHKLDDEKLSRKLAEIGRGRQTICQLGAQEAFEDFIISDEIVGEIENLTHLQSPLAMVTSLVSLIESISKALDIATTFKGLKGLTRSGEDRVASICSDDLIASLIYCLSRIRCEHLYSATRYLELFGLSCTARDKAAYYTATLQIVIQFVMNYRAEVTDDERVGARLSDSSTGSSRATSSSAGSAELL